MNIKQTAIAAAALLGSTAALAQAGVTLFGTADVNLRRVVNETTSRTALGNDGRNNSRIGIRGSEDLGGGLYAEFWLEGQTRFDNGTAAGLNFRRRSTVSLRSNSWGEIRLGRDYTPTFWGLSAFDPFGHNGVGLISNVDPHGALGTFVRSDNAVSYFLPQTVEGLTAQVMYASDQDTANAGYFGGRVDYTRGPLSTRFSVGRQYVNKLVSDAQFKTWSAGARYDFRVATLNMNYVHENLQATVAGIPTGTFTHWMVGTVVPVGGHEIKASYNQGSKNGDTVRQVAAGYVYHLSKRTALYSSVSLLKNAGAFALSVDAGLPNGQTAQSAAGRSRGLEFGITHHF